MEQQTISIAKAGIICTLNARSAILASANPINSKYEPKLSVVKNINIPPTLLSRFDLIYLMLDKHNDAYDRRLANHIVSLYGRFEEDDVVSKEKVISKELLTAYITEARKFEPKIHDDIEETIIKVKNKFNNLVLYRNERTIWFKKYNFCYSKTIRVFN
jgi:DNA replication licensing factor MCM4